MSRSSYVTKDGTVKMTNEWKCCSRCQRKKNADGLCPFNCHLFAKPHERNAAVDRKVANRERRASNPRTAWRDS